MKYKGNQKQKSMFQYNKAMVPWVVASSESNGEFKEEIKEERKIISCLYWREDCCGLGKENKKTGWGRERKKSKAESNLDPRNPKRGFSMGLKLFYIIFVLCSAWATVTKPCKNLILLPTRYEEDAYNFFKMRTLKPGLHTQNWGRELTIPSLLYTVGQRYPFILEATQI